MTSSSTLHERESVPCPLCGADSSERLFVTRDRLVGLPGEFTLARCRACGFVYLNPRPTPEALAGYYPDDYYPIDEEQESPEALAVARGLLARVQQAVPERNLRILDIGCGTGLFLKLAREVGHDVSGIELSESAAEYGRQVYSLPIQCATLESADLAEDSFDVVTMWHVLEHLPDPIAALAKVRRVLRPDGVVLFAVPNIASAEARVFGRRWFSLDIPRHLLHFSPDSARRAVESAGMSLLRIDHSPGTAGMVYSLMGDLSGISLRLRGRDISEPNYHRAAGVLAWVVWPFCAGAARLGRGGAIEVLAKKPVV
jgi:SAM-dependent methyltransferase